MTPPSHLQALTHVVAQREREQDRLGADLARQQGERERYLANLARLQSLTDATGASGVLPPSLAANCADYKQAVLHMAQRHREALARHDSGMEQTRAALGEAVRRHEALDQLRERQHRQWRAELETRARKQLDDMALTVWRRGQA